jgi:hypothetical protein
MIKAIIKRLREKREREAATAALIARRAMRTSNRRGDVAAAYEAKHLILARGRQS